MSPVDLDALAAWMDDHGLGTGPIIDVAPLGGGTQNILLELRRGADRFVLRHPPVHKRDGSDETMRREARVLAALVGTGVPHPRVVGACGDESVLGSAFYLMEPVDGTNLTVEPPPAYVDSPAWRRELGFAVVDGAAAIGAVDHVAVGLEGFGRSEGYLDRQVARWRGQLDSYRRLPGYPGPDLPGVEEVGAWLAANQPSTWQPGLIHGDYHFGNVLCALDRPALAAIVDWELATIGDPLVDLGWLLATWPADGRAPAPTLQVTPWEGLPTASEVVDRYARRTGRNLSAIGWYEILACYKLAIIVEGTHARACAGLAGADAGDVLHDAALRLLRRASSRLDRSGGRSEDGADLT